MSLTPGGKMTLEEWLLIRIAFKIQFPSKKHPYVFIVDGVQGVGKNLPRLDEIGRVVVVAST